jgi:hypothetical protein
MVKTDESLPVWTLGTDLELPSGFSGGSLTSERLSELRATLAGLADNPVATLEAHPRPRDLDRSRGIAVESTSPLARSLSTLVSQSSKVLANAPKEMASGETLYRMVVPASVADQVSKGLVRSMRSQAVKGGIHSALVDASGIQAQASFLPVGGEAVAAGGLVAISGPLILMGIAVGLSAYADYQQQKAIRELLVLLKKLDKHNLDTERAELAGCHDAIEMATALLLDEAAIGHGVGFGSAVKDIDTAIARAEGRLHEWTGAVADMPRRREDTVEIHKVIEAFPGIDKDGGEFQAHLELAALAIALKRRVILLQALEHAQLNPTNRFERFTRRIADAEASVNRLEAGIRALLSELASLRLAAPRQLKDFLFFTKPEVDRYLGAARELRELAAEVEVVSGSSDVAIEMVPALDGSVTVFPALPA